MFLPICKEDMIERGWTELDFVLVTGDAYVDHPSFGTAIIGRVLESHGYKVGIVAQPDWRKEEDFLKMGVPRYGYMVSSGNIDSMVNHYTVAKKRRSKDVYTPGDQPGKRPDRAVIVYCQKLRQIFKNTIPIMIGGLEASLRRFAHYDYWDDNIRKSILMDSQADLLMYGMGEHQCVEIAEALQSGLAIQDITFIKGTVYKTNTLEHLYEPVVLPDFQQIKKDKVKYAESFLIQYENTDAITAATLAEPYGNAYVVQNPPAAPLTQRELDSVYGLPYMRNYHPVYEKDGGISAIEEVKFSIVSNRGCFGNCNFCALAFHQGRVVTARSHPSIIEEAKGFIWEPDFKGYIHDVGGPTANFRQGACEKQKEKGVCKNKQCLYPKPCSQLVVSHKDYVLLLRKLREIPGVKKVFIRSGIRYDYLIADKDDTFFYELCEHHISGQLKVAPEHIHEAVLEKMGKPNRDVYEKFTEKYKKINAKLGKKQYLVPYLMSSHPGSDLRAAVQLAEYLQQSGFVPEQVQDFYPTPGTLSTCMYYTQIDPRTKQKVYVAKSPREKAMQRALIQYRNPKNYKLVEEALKKAGRTDLIGFGRQCLIRPAKKTEHKVVEKKKTARKIRNIHNKKSR